MVDDADVSAVSLYHLSKLKIYFNTIWIIVFTISVAFVIAVCSFHVWRWHRKEGELRKVPLSFIPTHPHEKQRYFTQRGMQFSWSSWVSLVTVVVFISLCIIQAFYSAVKVFPDGDDMDTRTSWNDEHFGDWKNFYRGSGRLVLLALAGIILFFYYVSERAETFRIYWMTPSTLNQAQWVLVSEVTDHRKQKGKKNAANEKDKTKKSKRNVDLSMRKQMLQVHEFKGIKYIHFCGIRYVWNDKTACFEPCPPPPTNIYDVESIAQGMTSEQAEDRRTGIGPNEVQLYPAFSLSVICMRTFLSPFFVFPLFGIWMQLLDTGFSHRDYAAVIITLVCLAAVFCFWVFVEWFSAFEIRHMLERQRVEVKVMRGHNTWHKQDSTQIVPGDVIQLSEGDVVPADCIIVNGGVMVDESALTGEPLPVPKCASGSAQKYQNNLSGRTQSSGRTQGSYSTWSEAMEMGDYGNFSVSMMPNTEPARDRNKARIQQERREISMRIKSMRSCDEQLQHASRISAGHIVVEGECRAFVTRTGGWSSQGGLLRAALFARRCAWKAEKSQWHLMIFAASVLYFFAIVRRIGILVDKSGEPLSGALGVVFSSWEHVVEVFNPLGDIHKIFRPEWPLGLAVVALLAQRRLKQMGVKSICYDSNSVAGGVDTMVFDKTGTITSKNLHMQGVHPFVGGAFSQCPVLWVDKIVRTGKPGWADNLPDNLRGAISECVLLEGDPQEMFGQLNFEVKNERRSDQNTTADDNIPCNSSPTALTRNSSFNHNVTSPSANGSNNDLQIDSSSSNSSSSNSDGDDSDAATEIWQDETTYLLDGQPRRGRSGSGDSDSHQSNHPQVAGNPVDQEIARQTNPGGRRRSTVILRRFSFDNATQTSAVVSHEPKEGKRYIICKGSFRRMAQLADIVPNNYMEVAEKHAAEGRYVLAIGARELGTNEDVVDRDAIERNLRLLGLIVFENHVKKDSAGALQQIFEGGIRPLICTGDNELAGAAVARKIGLLPNTALLATEWDGEVEWHPLTAANEHEPLSRRNTGSHRGSKSSNPPMRPRNSSRRSNSKTPTRIRRSGTDLPTTSPTALHLGLQRQGSNASSIGAYHSGMSRTRAADKPALVITGAALRCLYRNKKLTPILPDIKVVASATAQDKLLLIRSLQEEGHIVGMVGDGLNDAGALRQAHVGVALRVSMFASRVCAFSSSQDSLAIIPPLVKVGRCCLASCIDTAMYCVILGLLNGIGSLTWAACHYLLEPQSTWYSGWGLVVALYDHIIMALLFLAIFLRRPRKTLWKVAPTGEYFNTRKAVTILLVSFLISSVYFAGLAFIRLWDSGGKTDHYLPGGLKDYLKYWFPSATEEEPNPVSPLQSVGLDPNGTYSFRYLARHHNYDSSIHMLRLMTQPVFVAFILSAEKRWFLPFWQNPILLSVSIFCFLLWMVLIWAPPNYVSCSFHMNCENTWQWEHMGKCFYGPQLNAYALDMRSQGLPLDQPPLAENGCKWEHSKEYGPLSNEWPEFMRFLSTFLILAVLIIGYFAGRSWYKLTPKKQTRVDDETIPRSKSKSIKRSNSVHSCRSHRSSGSKRSSKRGSKNTSPRHNLKTTFSVGHNAAGSSNYTYNFTNIQATGTLARNPAFASPTNVIAAEQASKSKLPNDNSIHKQMSRDRALAKKMKKEEYLNFHGKQVVLTDGGNMSGTIARGGRRNRKKSTRFNLGMISDPGPPIPGFGSSAWTSATESDAGSSRYPSACNSPLTRSRKGSLRIPRPGGHRNSLASFGSQSSLRNLHKLAMVREQEEFSLPASSSNGPPQGYIKPPQIVRQNSPQVVPKKSSMKTRPSLKQPDPNRAAKESIRKSSSDTNVVRFGEENNETIPLPRVGMSRRGAMLGEDANNSLRTTEKMPEGYPILSAGAFDSEEFED